MIVPKRSICGDGVQRKPSHVPRGMVAELVRNPAVGHFMQHDGEYERQGHDRYFLYKV